MHRLRLLFQVVVEALFLVELMEQTLEVVEADETQEVDCVADVETAVHLMLPCEKNKINCQCW